MKWGDLEREDSGYGAKASTPEQRESWSRRDLLRKYVVRASEGRLNMVKEVKYLRVEVEEEMKFGKHVEVVGERVMKEFGALVRAAKANSGLEEAMMMLYRGIVEPIMLYCVGERRCWRGGH